MSAPAPCVCTALRKASRAVSRLYDERLADSGMTITQFAILRHLAREGDLPLSRLADLLVMERTSLYRTLAPIERHGWIAIAAGPSARIRIASLTVAGREALTRATGAWETAQEDIIGTIGAPAWQALAANLGTLVAISGVTAAR
jgi:DNA-binding MarR family transcriptional regulator